MSLNASMAGSELSPDGLPPLFGELITPSPNDLARQSELIGEQALSHLDVHPFGEDLAVEILPTVSDDPENNIYASGKQYWSGTFWTELVGGGSQLDDRWDQTE